MLAASSSSDPVVWWVLGGFFGLAVVALIGSLWYEKNRQKKLAQIADQLGFDFQPKNDTVSDRGLEGFDLFQQGRRQQCKNTMTGTLEDIGVAIFDYQYTVGHGKHQTTYRQTVAALQLPQPLFPAFTLKREHVFHKIGQAFGAKDIDFDDFPDFSKRYLLNGADEQAIRDFFTPDTLRYFEQLKPKWELQAHGHQMILYQRAKRFKPAQYDGFLKQAWDVLLAFPTA